METLLEWDTELLLLINGWHTTWADQWMWNVSDKWLWIPFYVVLAYGLFRRYGKRAFWLLTAVVLCVGCADFISSGIIKPLVCRPRPTQESGLEGMLHIVNGYRSGRFGFVSSHAANCFSLALLLSLVVHDWRTILPLTVYATLNCWSRIYLGVHYPGDILGGIVVGAFVAMITYGILRWCGDFRGRQAPIRRWEAWLPCYVLMLTLLVAALL